MSTDYGCALGGPGHKVNWLITHLQPPMTISLCDEDFPVGVIPLLASELGVDPGRLYDSVKRFTDREQAREAREHAKAAEDIDQQEREEMATDLARHDQASADQDEAWAARLEVDEHNEQVIP